jgi:hypothetical protein
LVECLKRSSFFRLGWHATPSIAGFGEASTPMIKGQNDKRSNSNRDQKRQSNEAEDQRKIRSF